MDSGAVENASSACNRSKAAGNEVEYWRRVDWAAHAGQDDLRETYHFAQWPIERAAVFFWSPLSFAFTNLKPVVPGHVLVAPKEVVASFKDLSSEQTKDLCRSVRAVAALLLKIHGATSYSITMQDGVSAGQTVAHVHFHVMPHFLGENLSKSAPAITSQLDNNSGEKSAKASDLSAAASAAGVKEAETRAVDPVERRARPRSELAIEASELRQYMKRLAEERHSNNKEAEGVLS